MTKIEWTRSDDGSPGRSWNPVVGCSLESPGCTNCYAMKMAARIEAMDRTTRHAPHYRGLTRKVGTKAVWTGEVRAAPGHILLEPLSWRTPGRCFVNSMSDLFHEKLTDEEIDRVFAVMACVPHVTFIVVTKRAERMNEYVRRVVRNRERFTQWAARGIDIAIAAGKSREAPPAWPLPNVWLLVSAEDQRHANRRIPILLDTPAAKRGVSLEPMIGPIRLDRLEQPDGAVWNALGGDHWHPGVGSVPSQTFRGFARLDWAITGGEDGDRPAPRKWFHAVRDQCHAAGVAYFHKQNGVHVPVRLIDGEWRDANGQPVAAAVRVTVGDEVFVKVAKKVAGAQLEGREWREFPT